MTPLRACSWSRPVAPLRQANVDVVTHPGQVVRGHAVPDRYSDHRFRPDLFVQLVSGDAHSQNIDQERSYAQVVANRGEAERRTSGQPQVIRVER